jgi:hypothetical protein
MGDESITDLRIVSYYVYKYFARIGASCFGKKKERARKNQCEPCDAEGARMGAKAEIVGSWPG